MLKEPRVFYDFNHFLTLCNKITHFLLLIQMVEMGKNIQNHNQVLILCRTSSCIHYWGDFLLDAQAHTRLRVADLMIFYASSTSLINGQHAKIDLLYLFLKFSRQYQQAIILLFLFLEHDYLASVYHQLFAYTVCVCAQWANFCWQICSMHAKY